MKRVLVLLLFAISLQAQAPPSFREGVLAFEKGDWAVAEQKMREAIASNPNETEGTVSIAGSWFETYVPHYFLARALAKQGKCAEAIKAFEESERQGVTPRIGDFARHLRTRGGCRPQGKAAAPKKVITEVTVPFGEEEVAAPAKTRPVAPPAPQKPKEPKESYAPLTAAVDAYLRGNYPETVRLLANVRFTDPNAAAEKALFLAAAYDALDRMTGEDHHARVEQELRTYRALRPNGRPNPRVFTPRFIARVRTGNPGSPTRSR